MVKGVFWALLVGWIGVAACDSGPQAVAPDAVSSPAGRPPAARPGEATPGAPEAGEPAAPTEEPAPPPPLSDLEISPARAVFEDAERNRAMGQSEAAIGLYQQAVSIDPQHHPAWGALFDMMRRGDDPEAAATACAGLLASRDFTGHEASLRNLQCALAHRETGQLEQAETYARASVETGGQRLEPLVTLSAILLQRGELEAVIELFDGRLRDTGGSQEASAHSNLGTAYMRLGRFEEAVTAYQVAERIDADRIDVLINLSEALNRAGRPEEAAEVIERARTIDPDHPAVQSPSP